MLDGTETDFIKAKAQELIRNPKIGRVAQVYEHLDTDDNSNFEVDVIMDGGLFEERPVPYTGVHSSGVAIPRVGDKVVVGYLDGTDKRPFAFGTPFTNKDRPPLGRAGMYRDEYESGTSPAGDGNIKVTGYTEYSDNPARIDKDDLDPVKTWVQISKQEDTPDPHVSDDAPMTIEMYESPTTEDDEAHIRLNGNMVDGDDTKALDVKLDFKTGKVKVAATDANEFGIEMNAKTGEFKVLDDGGYGIVSDGAGNFTWHYETIDYSEGTTTSL